MCRQLPHRTSAAASGHVAAVTLATGLLIGSNLPLALAQQSPDTWSAQQRAVLPSGLTVQLDFAPAPGVTSTPAPGKLADRTGTTSAYSDGIRPGDPAETFLIAEQHPQAAWHTTGTLRLTFSRAVRNPRLHLSGLAAPAAGTSTAARLTVTGGYPSAPKLSARTPWQGWTVTTSDLAPAGDGTADGAGTVELTGTVSSVTFRVDQCSSTRAGNTTPPPQLRHAYTVTLDEDLGTAPQQYGNASHLVSDLFLGQDAVGSTHSPSDSIAHPLLPGPAPMGTDRRGSSAEQPPPQLQPGRGEYKGADPMLKFPAETAIGGYYDLTVPVSTGGGPAVLAGWIDFNHSGHFEPATRVQAEIPAGASSAVLEWTVPEGAVSGETWARLRIARTGAQLVGSGGFADSGEVVDQKIQLAFGPPKPEIAAPVSGTVTADDRSPLGGDGGTRGATVAITEGDAILCQASVGSDGSWNCRPGRPLAQGPHSLTPVESTRSGTLRGEPIRLVVKNTAPSAPVFTLPEYTNEPDPLLSGNGEPGSTVWVSDRGVDGRGGGDVCVTAVLADSTWSCLPVENLADGRHQLTATAVDQAGNHTDGKSATLTVATAAPDKPVLSSPTPGSTLHTARPQLTGHAQPGATVTVTTLGAGSERTALCSATVAADGSWSCTPTRDLANGDRTLVATVTDRAGNATPGDPLTVHIAAPAASPSGEPSRPASPSVAGSPSPSASSHAIPSAQGSPPGTASPSTSVGTPPIPSGVPPIVVPPVASAPIAGPAPVSPSTPVRPQSSAARPSAHGSAPARSTAPAASSSPAASPSDGSRLHAAPPAAPPAASSDHETDPSARKRELPSWRIAAWSVLLTLVALGLFVRRVLGRGPGARRR